MSGPFKMKGNPFQRNFKLSIGEGQGSKRRGKYILDPDAPGGKYGPGYEPTVREEDKSPLKGKKRKARKAKKDAEIRASALSQAETNEDLRKSIETKTGKTIEELKNE